MQKVCRFPAFFEMYVCESGSKMLQVLETRNKGTCDLLFCLKFGHSFVQQVLLAKHINHWAI